MFDLGTPWWEILLRSAIVYVAVLVGLRLTGKRQLGQLAPFDLVVIILIANAVQNAMVGTDTSIGGGLISAGTLLVMHVGVGWLQDRFPWLRRAAEGNPTVLVSDGVVVSEHLRHEGISVDELEQACREHGVEGITAVKMAVLEVDGSISIVPRGSETVRTARRYRQRHQHQ